MKFILSILFCTIIFLPEIHSQESISKVEDIRHQFHFEGGALIGGYITLNNFTYNSGYTIQGTYYYELHPQFHLGGGLGLDKLSNVTLIPIYASMRGSLRKSGGPAYLFAHIGFSRGFSSGLFDDLDYDFRSGFLFNPGVGIKAWDAEKVTLLFTIGYKLQLTNIEYIPFANADPVQSELDHHFLTLRIGLSF